MKTVKKHFLLIICLIYFLFIVASSSYAQNQSNLYEVKPGDTLSKIAKEYHTSIAELKLYNGLQANTVSQGQKLLVPITYTVRSGDTLKRLSSTFQLSSEAIKKINRLSSDQLQKGQQLRIIPKKLNMHGQHIVMTREQFKTWLENNTFNRKITLIQHHHTWQPSYKDFTGNNHFAMLESMENFHRKNMNWKTIAQNLTTFPDGTIAISRPFNIAPEGSIGNKANYAGLMIENIGNFDIGHDVMTKEQKDTIVYMTALLCLKFGLTPSIDSITYHHWWNLKTGERVLDNAKSFEVKTCPGTGFFGGNTTTSAKKYFYPLIQKKMNDISSTME